MGASQCLYIHTRAHTLNAYLYIHAHTHTHTGMRRTRDNLLLVHGRTHVHTYIHKHTCGLAHARRCCQRPVCLSLSRLHGQPSPGANISVSNVQVCIACVFRHAYTCQTLVVGIVKQFAIKLSPPNSQTRAPGRMFRMHMHL
jgi:hypothetical protein